MVVHTRLNELLSRWEVAATDDKPTPEELCGDSPELLQDLRDAIRRLQSADQHLASGPAQGEMDMSPPQIQDYTIESLIGRGGMGTVWRATQLGTCRTVALKVISAGEFASPRARARFEREVELASRLNHPNIARVYDSGIHRGAFYYAMELIDHAMPLDRYVESRGLDRRAILELMRAICAAVQHAHQLGVIHRDL